MKTNMKTKEKFTDIEVGDVVVVFDEYSHDYIQHRIKVESIEYHEDDVTEDNPEGMLCYGKDLDEEEFGDDYMTVATIGNFCFIVKETTNE